MKTAQQMARDHVDWWLGSVRQLLVDNFVHGYKHGQRDAFNEVDEIQRVGAEHMEADLSGFDDDASRVMR